MSLPDCFTCTGEAARLPSVSRSRLISASALVADARLRAGADNPFYPRKLASARFYVENLLPRALGCAQVIRNGSAALLDYAEDWL